MSVAVLHECVVCGTEILGKTGEVPENWGAFMDDTELCSACVKRWKERFKEFPPVYNLEDPKYDW